VGPKSGTSSVGIAKVYIFFQLTKYFEEFSFDTIAFVVSRNSLL